MTVMRARWATEDDAAEIVRLRRLMFADMGFDTRVDDWEAPARRAIRDELRAGRLVAAVVDPPDGSAGLAASGVVQFETRLPSPGFPGTTKGYLSSMSTDPRWQRRGLARDVITLLLAECNARGAAFVDLHATAAGRPLYEQLGFGVRGGNPELRLYLT